MTPDKEGERETMDEGNRSIPVEPGTMELLAVRMVPRISTALPTIVGVVNRAPLQGRHHPWFTMWGTGHHASEIGDGTADDADGRFLAGFQFRRAAGWVLDGAPVVIRVAVPQYPSLLEGWFTREVFPAAAGPAPATTPASLGRPRQKPFRGRGVPEYRKRLEIDFTAVHADGKRV